MESEPYQPQHPRNCNTANSKSSQPENLNLSTINARPSGAIAGKGGRQVLMDSSVGIDFDNTEVAFKHYSDRHLHNAIFLFKMMAFKPLVLFGSKLINHSLKWGLPVDFLVKKTLYSHFCGGESLQDCLPIVDKLSSAKVASLFDYSVEGNDTEESFAHAEQEFRNNILYSYSNKMVTQSVFKMTALIGHEILRKKSLGETLSTSETRDLEEGVKRVDRLCSLAKEKNVELLIDAEESWIQVEIDRICLEMMERYNRGEVVIFNTYQLYRHDKRAQVMADLDFLKARGAKLGVKIVRGAYLEKEQDYAEKHGVPCVVHTQKENTDRDFNGCLSDCLENIDSLKLFVGSHNVDSMRHLATKMSQLGIPPGDERIMVSQLFGMGDNITFNMAKNGYRANKYIPYGPLKSMMPYLTRRAEENSSIQGQAGRELKLFLEERLRRKQRSTYN